MKKSVFILLMSSLFVLSNCNKVAKQGGKIAERTVVEKSAKVVLSKSIREKLETSFGPVVAINIAKKIENKPELVKLLEEKGQIFYSWVYLNKQLPNRSLDYDFVKLFVYSDKFSKFGRFGGNKIENFIYREGKDGEVLIKSKSGLDLGKILVFVDPPKVILYETNSGKVIRNMFANLHPFPNVQYELGGVVYKTDSWGRIVSSEFKIDKNYISNPNLYNAKDITAAGKLKGGLAGDDGGHLLAQQFGGSSTVLNVVPMKSSVNKGEYKKVEELWRKEADKGRIVKANINLKYGNSVSERPTWIEIKYEIDGEKYVKLIPNE